MIRHSVVLVPFPFDDFSGNKLRPALCLTGEIGKYQHVVIAFISSKLEQNPTDSDLLVLDTEEGFSLSGLAVSSVIKLHRLVTVPKNLIKRKLGELSPVHQQKVKLKLKEIFTLD
jgi:mRNA interferase MazF